MDLESAVDSAFRFWNPRLKQISFLCHHLSLIQTQADRDSAALWKGCLFEARSDAKSSLWDAETRKPRVFLRTRVERVLEYPPQVEALLLDFTQFLLNSMMLSKAVTVLTHTLIYPQLSRRKRQYSVQCQQYNNKCFLFHSLCDWLQCMHSVDVQWTV